MRGVAEPSVGHGLDTLTMRQGQYLILARKAAARRTYEDLEDGSRKQQSSLRFHPAKRDNGEHVFPHALSWMLLSHSSLHSTADRLEALSWWNLKGSAVASEGVCLHDTHERSAMYMYKIKTESQWCKQRGSTVLVYPTFGLSQASTDRDPSANSVCGSTRMACPSPPVTRCPQKCLD